MSSAPAEPAVVDAREHPAVRAGVPGPERPPLLTRVGAALRPSSIAANIPGPIFHKEVWVAGRRSGPYWIRGLYAAGLLGLVALVFGAARSNSWGSSSAQRLQQLQQIAPAVTLAIVWFQQIALSIVAIILAAPAVCDEQRAGTLGTLLTTPLRAWQIVLGKLAGLLVQIFVLALIAAPLLLAVRVFGGVEAATIGKAASLWVSGATLAACLGMYFSVGAKRSPSAAAAALIAFAFLSFVGPLVIWGWSEAVDRLGLQQLAVSQVWIFRTSPMLALFALSAEIMGETRGMPFVNGWEWAWSSGWNLAISLLAFVIATVRLRAVMRSEGASGAPAPESTKTEKTKAGAAAEANAAAKPAERDLGASREVGDNPVLWREARQPFFRNRLQRTVVLGAVTVFMLWLYWVVGWRHLDEQQLHFPLLVVLTLIAAMIGIFSSATLISGERESRTWDVLLATPSSAMDLVLGKFWGAVRKQWFAPGILMTHLVLMTLLGRVHFMIVPEVALILVCTVCGVGATGVMFSAMIGKSVRAAAANFFLWLTVWAIIPGIGGILFEFLRGGMTDSVLSALLIPNPVGMVVVAGTGTVHSDWRSGGYELYDFGRLGTFEFLLTLAFFAFLYFVACLLALRMAASHISRTTFRRVW